MVSLRIAELRIEDLPLVKKELKSDTPIDFEEHFQLQQLQKETVLIAWLENSDEKKFSTPIGRMLLVWDGEVDLKKVVGKVPNAEKYGSIPAIMRFWIKPEYRSRGFGWQILLFAQKLTKDKGFDKISLAVYEDNPKALALYKKFGFKETDVPLFMLEPPFVVNGQKPFEKSKVMRYLVKDLSE